MSEVQEVGSYSTFLFDQQGPQQAQPAGGERQCSIEGDEASTELENHWSSSSSAHIIYNTSSSSSSQKTENKNKNTHNDEKQNNQSSITEPTPMYISSLFSPSLLKLAGKINKQHSTSIMVDSGSTGDFISSTLVGRLQLPTHRLQPIREVYLADGSKHLCSQQVKCRIETGAISEVVQLAVIPLEAYDIIYGQPWLRRHNPSIDWSNGSVSINSLSLPTIEPSLQVKSSPIELVSAVGIKHAMQAADTAYLVLVSDKSVAGEGAATQSIDSRIRSLLNEFKDVFPEDLPEGLPPRRDVDHRIELMPGSTPPTRPAYG
jgi:hypothetical protein